MDIQHTIFYILGFCFFFSQGISQVSPSPTLSPILPTFYSLYIDFGAQNQSKDLRHLSRSGNAPLSRSRPYLGPLVFSTAPDYLYNSIYSLFCVSLGSTFRKGNQDSRAWLENNFFPSPRLTQTSLGGSGRTWCPTTPEAGLHTVFPETENKIHKIPPSCKGSPSTIPADISGPLPSPASLGCDKPFHSIPLPNILLSTQAPSENFSFFLPLQQKATGPSTGHVQRSLVSEFLGKGIIRAGSSPRYVPSWQADYFKRK